jgi:transketolase
MRMIPGLVVIDPCDAVEIQAATRTIADYDGPVYMRLLRGAVPVSLPSDHRFEIGKAYLLREGRDIGIISTGLMTTNALEAADRLDAQGINVGILHVPTIKPFDTGAVVAFASAFPRLVTAENHVVVGGLGSLVVEALHEASVQVPVTRIGLPDCFIPCGSVPTLQARYGITPTVMVEAIARLATGGP